MKFNMRGGKFPNAIMSYKIFSMINAIAAEPAAIGICEAVSAMIS